MNIIEAYCKVKGKLIILVSGLSGSGKTYVAKNVNNDLKLGYLDLESFRLKDFNKKIIVTDKLSMINWDDLDSYDWDKFNKEVDVMKHAGVIISGVAFPTARINFKSDVHVHVKVKRQDLIDNRRKFIRKHPDKCEKFIKLIGTPEENAYINKIVYPEYMKNIEASHIDRFIGGNLEEICDQTFEFIIKRVQGYLDNHNKELTNKKKKFHMYDDTGYYGLAVPIDPDDFDEPQTDKYPIKDFENKFVGVE